MRPGVHAERPSPVTRRDFMSFIEVSPQVSSRSLALKKDHVDLETHVADSLAFIARNPPIYGEHKYFLPIDGKHETRGGVDL